MKRRSQWIGLAFLLAMGLMAGCSQGAGQGQEAEPEQNQAETEEDEAGTGVPQDTADEEKQWYAKGDEIEGQCFETVLEPLGAVSFLSYDPGETAGEYADVVFLIKKNGVVWQQLEGMTEDNVREGLKVESVDAVSFGDYNQDGFDDILVICTYMDSQEEPACEVRYYEGSSQGNFALMRELSGTMTEELATFTIAGARDYLAAEFGLPSREPAEPGAGGTQQSTLDVAGQLDLIAENRELWRGTEDYVDYRYIVTDLDQNGRLEIMNASMQGTGLYTFASCFEVNPDGTGLDEVVLEGPEYDAWPDIIVDKARVHYDSQGATYWYEITDMTRNGAAESYYTKTILAKKNQTVVVERIAMNAVLASENSESHTYYNADGDEVTKGEYEEAVSRRCEGMEQKSVLLGWLYMQAGEIDLFSGEELRRKLEESWSSFLIS